MDEQTATKASAAKRVLIVDDEPSVLSVLRASFASFRHGHAYRIITAESAADAFTLLRQEHFDLILLDIVMPAASGRWLTEKNLGLGLLTRFHDLGVTAPVLLITGAANDAAKEAAAQNAAVVGYLYKPIDLRELDAAVARVLGFG
jgi:two-component system phosphate regulon response regulator OmpR